MKKTFLLIFALVLGTASTTFAQKFGYCNSLAVLASLPDVKAADSDLGAFQTQLQKKGEQMVQDLQAKATELKRKQELGTIAPKDYAEQEAKLREDEANIQKYAQEMEEKVGQKREELYKPILEKVEKAIQDVAKENTFTMIFDVSTQVLLYGDESLNITPLVFTKLGVPMPAELDGGK